MNDRQQINIKKQLSQLETVFGERINKKFRAFREDIQDDLEEALELFNKEFGRQLEKIEEKVAPFKFIERSLYIIKDLMVQNTTDRKNFQYWMSHHFDDMKNELIKNLKDCVGDNLKN